MLMAVYTEDVVLRKCTYTVVVLCSIVYTCVPSDRNYSVHNDCLLCLQEDHEVVVVVVGGMVGLVAAVVAVVGLAVGLVVVGVAVVVPLTVVAVVVVVGLVRLTGLL